MAVALRQLINEDALIHKITTNEDEFNRCIEINTLNIELKHAIDLENHLVTRKLKSRLAYYQNRAMNVIMDEEKSDIINGVIRNIHGP